MTFTKRSERGFTVIELLAVIAIMLVITAIATPSFYYWLPKYRLSAGARQIAAGYSHRPRSHQVDLLTLWFACHLQSPSIEIPRC